MDREFFTDTTLIYNQDGSVASTGWYASGPIARYQDRESLSLEIQVSCDSIRFVGVRADISEESEENPAYE
jgi:hypothetical protein